MQNNKNAPSLAAKCPNTYKMSFHANTLTYAKYEITYLSINYESIYPMIICMSAVRQLTMKLETMPIGIDWHCIPQSL